MRPNNNMAYPSDAHTFQGAPLVAAHSSATYGSSQDHQATPEDWNSGYINSMRDEAGEWRQYVGQNGYEDVVYWQPQSSQQFATQEMLNPDQLLNTHYHSPPPVLIAQGRNAVRQAARATPDPDMTNVALHLTTSAKRKRSAKSKDKPKRPALEKPLSELTKNLTAPVKDMETWVNRSTEERRKEKRSDGTIKRPSNSFMLYRSAYTERTRELEQSRNHQDISSIAGSSWAIETPEIKAQFEEWAKTERENHQKAFPDYKFQPQTQASKDRKRKQRADDTSEEPSDLEDSLYRNGRTDSPSQTRSSRSKNPRTTYREYSDSPSFPSSDEVNTPESYLPIEGNRSYFPSINPGKPLPAAVDRISQAPGYYVTSSPNAEAYGVLASYDSPGSAEDTGYYSVEPQVEYPSTSAPVGLPGMAHNELVGEMPLGAGQMTLSGSHIVDPDLGNTGQNLNGLAESVDDPLPPLSARSFGFHTGDYLRDSEGNSYLSPFTYDENFGS